MHWTLWIVFANVGIFWLERVYRVGVFSNFISGLPYMIIPMLIGQVGLFYGYRGAPSLLLAGALFTLINIILRIVNSYYIGETPNTYTWLGILFLIISLTLLKIK